jgi:hypothetical protein
MDLPRVNKLLAPRRVNDGGGFQPVTEQIHQGRRLRKQIEIKAEVKDKGLRSRVAGLRSSLNLSLSPDLL